MTTSVFTTAYAHQVLSTVGLNTHQLWDGLDQTGGTLSISTTINRRTGGYSLDVNKTSSGSNVCFARHDVQPTNNLRVVRFYVYFQSLPAATTTFHSFNGSGDDFEMRVSATQISVKFSAVGTTQTQSGTVTTGVWYRIDYKVDISGTTHTADWQIDGVAQTQLSVSSSANTLLNFNLGVPLSSTQVWRLNFTDVIVSNTSGDYPIGEGKGYYLLPTGMGTHVNEGRFQDGDGTAIDANSYQLVDDWPPIVTGGNTAFIKQVTVDAGGEASYIEFTMADRSDGEGDILGVEGVLSHGELTSNPNLAGCVIRDNSGTESEVLGTDGTPVSYADGTITAPGYANGKVTTPGGGWTTSELNALVFRCGYGTDVNPVPFWKALLIEYDVAPLVADDLSPTGIPSGQAFGTAQLTLDNHNLLPTGIPTGQAFGVPFVSEPSTDLYPTGIASAQAFGTASLAVNLSPTGIVSGQTFGTSRVAEIKIYNPVSKLS